MDLVEIVKGVIDGYEEFDFFFYGNSYGINGDLFGFINFKLFLCLKVFLFFFLFIWCKVYFGFW